MQAYLDACIKEAPNDAEFLAKAPGEIAPARGVTQVARDAGLSRESLDKALSGDRMPDFE
jgi:probable addiction module antidote protein